MANRVAEDGVESEDDSRTAPRRLAVIESVCHDVNGAMGVFVLCIDFLASQTGNSDDPALLDARSALQVVTARMKRLREVAIGLKAEANDSGVFRV